MTEACYRTGGAPEVDAAMAVMVRAFDPAFGEAWNRGQCLAMLSLPGVWLGLAEDANGSALGFALSRIVVDEAELLLLAVDPVARRRGVGSFLIRQTATEASARGARRLMLEMRDDNPAVALYRQTGFDPIGRRAGYYRGADNLVRDAVTLALPLSSIG